MTGRGNGGEAETLLNGATRARLEEYTRLLGRWRKITNLISDESFTQIWDRHILDGVQLQRQRPQAHTWLDIGSGAGLPGVVIASLIFEYANARVHCVEIDRRKCAFLREVASKLDLPLKVHNTLAEQIDFSKELNIDVVTARAFSSMDRILYLANPLMRRGAAAVLPRGRNFADEIARLDPTLYSIRSTPNPTTGDGAFVHIEIRDSRAS